MKVSSANGTATVISNNNQAEKPTSTKKGWRKAVDEGSQVSDLSESTDDDVDEDESLGERSQDYENFEKTLRSKHSKACKAMSVGIPLDTVPCKSLLGAEYSVYLTPRFQYISVERRISKSFSRF